MTEHSRYLGDGAYVGIESGRLKLWTSDGDIETRSIYMDGPVLSEFLRWVATYTVVEMPSRKESDTNPELDCAFDSLDALPSVPVSLNVKKACPSRHEDDLL